MKTNPISILQDLIRCPSVTPRDAGALSVLQSLLTDAGFHCSRLPFEDIDNLFASIGHGAPHLCFAGHTDVVPAGDESIWTHPPFAAEIENGHVYGRGASDMKGSVAAFVSAAITHVHSFGKPNGTLSFLITGDEEGAAVNGTVKVLPWMKDNALIPDHCLVGEPTCVDHLGDAIKIGRRGSLSFAVTVEGKQGHVAYPHKADNPIPKLAALVESLSRCTLDAGNQHFDPSTLAITSFDVGNAAGNVIPSKAVLKFNIRFSTEHDYASLRTFVDEQIAAAKQVHGGEWRVASSEGAEAFTTEPGAFVGIVMDAIQEETGLTPKLSTSGGTSDARFIKDFCPVLEFGPTNATIHQTDERMSIVELEATTRIYQSVIERYFSS